MIDSGGFLVPAGTLPSSSNNVVLFRSVINNTGTIPTVGNLNINGNSINITINVNGTTNFGVNGQLVSGGTIYGNCNLTSGSIIQSGAFVIGDVSLRFSGAINDGTITGNAFFYNSSINSGTVDGDATFYDTSTNSGIVTGTVYCYSPNC